jgi:hypothetical protein
MKKCYVVSSRRGIFYTQEEEEEEEEEEAEEALSGLVTSCVGTAV